MRIGVDCTSINTKYKGGVNTYILGLLSGLVTLKNQYKYELVIFCHKNDKFFFNDFIGKKGVRFVTINYKSKVLYFFMLLPFIFNSLIFWRKFSNLYSELKGIKRKIEENCDILLAPKTILNYYNLKIPTILSMHDIQQYHYPEFFTKFNLRYRKLTYENSAKVSEYFQASSQFIKEDLLEHFKFLEANQIFVIPEGVNIKEFQKGGIKFDVKRKYNLPDKFLFFPAQLWKHKNHITVLKALKKLANEGLDIPLVLTGAKYSGSKDVFDFINKNNMKHVYYLGKISFHDIIALYHKATFLITAVLYESSSLPILEAAASGTAIIASKTPPNQELANNLDINMFSPLDVDNCAKVIKGSWLASRDDIKKHIDKNLDSINQYSWDKVAEKYLNNIRKIIN